MVTAPDAKFGHKVCYDQTAASRQVFGTAVLVAQNKLRWAFHYLPDDQVTASDLLHFSSELHTPHTAVMTSAACWLIFDEKPSDRDHMLVKMCGL